MLARIPSRLFCEWIAYSRLEPFGPRESAWQAAVIASTVGNTARNEKTHPRPFSPDEFMEMICPVERNNQVQVISEPEDLQAKIDRLFNMV